MVYSRLPLTCADWRPACWFSWRKSGVRVAGPLHRETHYFGGPVFLSASSLAGLARFNNPPKAAFCERSSYALNVSEQVPSPGSQPPILAIDRESYSSIGDIAWPLPSEGKGHTFESCRVRQIPPGPFRTHGLRIVTLLSGRAYEKSAFFLTMQALASTRLLRGRNMEAEGAGLRANSWSWNVVTAGPSEQS